MRILNILLSKGWGGLERYAIGQAAELARRGHETYFISRTNTPTSSAVEKEKGIEGGDFRPFDYVDLSAITAIRSFIKERKIEIVNVSHSADLGLVAPALWRMPGVKLVFLSYMQTGSDKKDIYHRMEYGRVDHMLVSGELMRKNAIEHLPIDSDKVKVLPYGLDLKMFAPKKQETGLFRKKYGLPQKAPIIGVISRLDPAKGQMEIIEAMPSILEKHPKTYLALVGDETQESGGVYLPALKERVKSLGLEDRILFTGFAKNTAEVLADLTLFFLPAHQETFSLSCLEAMAMAIPVAGTNSGGTPETLDNGKCGVLFEPKSQIAIATTAIDLLNDPTLALRMGALGRERVELLHDKDTVVDRLLSIYDS